MNNQETAQNQSSINIFVSTSIYSTQSPILFALSKGSKMSTSLMPFSSHTYFIDVDTKLDAWFLRPTLPKGRGTLWPYGGGLDYVGARQLKLVPWFPSLAEIRMSRCLFSTQNQRRMERGSLALWLALEAQTPMIWLKFEHIEICGTFRQVLRDLLCSCYRMLLRVLERLFETLSGSDFCRFCNLPRWFVLCSRWNFSGGKRF